MNSLEQIIEKLKSNPEVDSVFLTGSYATKEAGPHSDIDLVIIFRENQYQLRSLYRWINGVFADIFFFDLADLQRISSTEKIDWNSPDGNLANWIKKAEIQFDQSGTLSALKKQVETLDQTGVVTKDKQSFWQKINYNFIANQRYFESADPLYHEALELRLLYSTIELIGAYLALRDMPWQGEKSAVLYLKKNAPDFYAVFKQYLQAKSVKERFANYAKMFSLVLTEEYGPWHQEDHIVITTDNLIVPADDMIHSYTKSLFE
mgnify:CR=1 FL=1